MKRLIPFLSIAFLAACNSTPQKEDVAAPLTVQQQVPAIDTAGLAQYQAWRAQNELADVQELTAPKQQASAPVYKAPAKRSAPVRRASNTRTSAPSRTSSDNSVASNDGVGSQSSESTQPAKKKGISKAAKGAVIGGVTGAAGGAVINKKNRVAGAVIGAVIGAGGGYVIGRKMDKKDGRIEYVPSDK